MLSTNVGAVGRFKYSVLLACALVFSGGRLSLPAVCAGLLEQSDLWWWLLVGLTGGQLRAVTSVFLSQVVQRREDRVLFFLFDRSTGLRTASTLIFTEFYARSIISSDVHVVVAHSSALKLNCYLHR
jgi:hypothetical protein